MHRISSQVNDFLTFIINECSPNKGQCHNLNQTTLYTLLLGHSTTVNFHFDSLPWSNIIVLMVSQSHVKNHGRFVFMATSYYYLQFMDTKQGQCVFVSVWNTIYLDKRKYEKYSVLFRFEWVNIKWIKVLYKYRFFALEDITVSSCRLTKYFETAHQIAKRTDRSQIGIICRTHTYR